MSSDGKIVWSSHKRRISQELKLYCSKKQNYHHNEDHRSTRIRKGNIIARVRTRKRRRLLLSTLILLKENMLNEVKYGVKFWNLVLLLIESMLVSLCVNYTEKCIHHLISFLWWIHQTYFCFDIRAISFYYASSSPEGRFYLPTYGLWGRTYHIWLVFSQILWIIRWKIRRQWRPKSDRPTMWQTFKGLNRGEIVFQEG